MGERGFTQAWADSRTGSQFLTAILHPKLEVSEDLPFQRRWWRIQRVGWVAMLLVIISAVAGAFGDGPLSTVYHSSASGRIEVIFDRIVRRSSPQEITFQVRIADGEGPVILRAPRAFFQHSQLDHVYPQPLRSETDAGYWAFHFAPASGSSALWIRLELQTTEAGRQSGIFTVDQEELVISQFVLP
jgi:hypothetical protein